MSPRQNVDRERIRTFFERLSREFRQPARIYLVGGTSLVFEDLRAQTLDIDIAIDIDPAHHGRLLSAIRDLKNVLATNVEEASPADFIPLPADHTARHQFLERFGQIELFHFDLYSAALSKIDRGRRQDYEDVLTLLTAGKIQWDSLVNFFKEILPQMGLSSLKQDPKEFEANFRTLEQMWRAG